MDTKVKKDMHGKQIYLTLLLACDIGVQMPFKFYDEILYTNWVTLANYMFKYQSTYNSLNYRLACRSVVIHYKYSKTRTN